MNSGKTPGADGITADLYKAIGVCQQTYETSP